MKVSLCRIRSPMYLLVYFLEMFFENIINLRY